MVAAAPAADAADSPEVWKRPCPPDCGVRSAALPSGAEAECRDAAGWGGEAEWSPASGCMLIRWGGGVPRFLRPTTGAGGWAAAAARSQGLPPAPATTARPLPLAPAQARAPRPPGGAGDSPSVLLACGLCPLSLRGGKFSHTDQRGKPHIPGKEPRGHPLVGVPHPFPCAASQEN